MTTTMTQYRVPVGGREFIVHAFQGMTTFDEEFSVTLPSGRVVTDKVRVLQLDRCVQESDIERELLKALEESR